MTIPGYVDVKQVAKKLGVTRQTVWNYHNSGRMPRGILVGRGLIWPELEIDRWIASRRGQGWRRGMKGPITKVEGR